MKNNTVWAKTANQTKPVCGRFQPRCCRQRPDEGFVLHLQCPRAIGGFLQRDGHGARGVLVSLSPRRDLWEAYPSVGKPNSKGGWLAQLDPLSWGSGPEDRVTSQQQKQQQSPRLAKEAWRQSIQAGGLQLRVWSCDGMTGAFPVFGGLLELTGVFWMNIRFFLMFRFIFTVKLTAQGKPECVWGSCNFRDAGQCSSLWAVA